MALEDDDGIHGGGAPKVSFSISRSICKANSRVGANIKAAGEEGVVSVLDGRHLCLCERRYSLRR